MRTISGTIYYMNTVSITTSNARKNLYSLIKEVSKGIKSYEIRLRGNNESVMLINKAELESWQETLDILSSPEERNAVRQGLKEKKTISHKNLLNAIGLGE